MREVRFARGTAARLCGRTGAAVAAVRLMLRGCRILGLRLVGSVAEIHLPALRGGVLAGAHAERRADLRERLGRAGAHIAALRNAALRLDLITLAPGRAPRHIPDAWAGA